MTNDETTQWPPMPLGIARLPRRAGVPVPWFVAEVDGDWDFRVMDPAKLLKAVKERRCWVCGRLLLGAGTFVLGPMCGVNRTSSEPPSHASCAVWSAQACPFLSNPSKVRREAHMPDGSEAAGIMVKRNPGVTLLWVSKGWSIFKCPRTGGPLFDIGEPQEVSWWHRSRPATHAEVLQSISDGLPALVEVALPEGPMAVEALSNMVSRLLQLLPKQNLEPV